MKFLELYIGVLFSWIINYFIGKKFLKLPKKNKIIQIVVLVLIFSIALVLINYYTINMAHGMIKIILAYMLLCLFYKIIFEDNLSKILIVSLILYIIFSVSEIILAITFSIIIYFNDYKSLAFLQNTMAINILNTSLSYLLIKLGNNKLQFLLRDSKFNDRNSILIIILILITITLIIFRLPVSRWSFNPEFIFTMIILFCGCMIGLLLIKQKAEIQKTTSLYQKLAEYSDITNKVLEEYRVVTHESKNQLLVIRSMLDNKDKNKELKDYVDNLLEKRENLKYPWIGQLNYIPLSGLKGLINYKLIEMKSQQIEIITSVSKEISKVKLNKLTTKQKDSLYSIIGIYLDNAMQSAKESIKKEFSLEIYKEEKKVIITLANTYKGKIDDYGYTTKGKNHGVGLHIVKRILEEDSIFKQSRKLFEDYFVQELQINLEEIKNE